jgi:hypothetical protein
MHWLQGSVFQGHTKLDAKDVSGVLHCFARSKGPDETSTDTGLNKATCQLLLDKLRMASALVAVELRDETVFESCQVEADETVIRKEKHYEVKPDGAKVRTGTTHHSVICLTQRGSTKTVVDLVDLAIQKIACVAFKAKGQLSTVEERPGIWSAKRKAWPTKVMYMAEPKFVPVDARSVLS